MKIVHWTIKYTTDDGKEHFINDVPNFVAKPVDEILDSIEREENESPKDICYKCGKSQEYGTMKDANEIDFAIYCDKCNKEVA